MPLTAKACDNAKPAAKAYKMADGGGLYLEIMPTGAKYWRCKYRFLGKEKRLAFGVYPEVGLASGHKYSGVSLKRTHSFGEIPFSKHLPEVIKRMCAIIRQPLVAKERGICLGTSIRHFWSWFLDRDSVFRFDG